MLKTISFVKPPGSDKWLCRFEFTNRQDLRLMICRSDTEIFAYLEKRLAALPLNLDGVV